ncbi:trypsin-like peptidase domain-containing protein [Luteolibacter sp. GHJ8]|uniref:Trypsin-like peptidase domain-containing protein n=1 Tax=Luteolibacter rhizosphaerae TaxID=2989719 RepID=A0ABT3FWR1_9BACT|nr:trypsin-like peptidase domain-containing protein [Luteolibacter rhizosphaerae]MCW1912038.1 trypsin-like peptidase domain-containing protein [Luteolibacter rhizosphaerae]
MRAMVNDVPARLMVMLGLLIPYGVMRAQEDGTAGSGVAVGGLTTEVRTKAGEEHRAKAEAGDALAQAMLADALYYGLPSDAAFAEAAQWAEKSAAGGCPIGTAILADMFRTGKGRAHDEKKAEELAEASREPLLAGTDSANAVWLRWAALSPPRETEGLYFVGSLEGNAKHLGRNLPLMRRAIAAGDVQAAVEWAERIYKWKDWGSGREDEKKVIEVLQRAWKEGHPAATHMLGDMYAFGILIPMDEAKAETFYIEAAAAGWNPSRLALAKVVSSRYKGFVREALLRKLQEDSRSPKDSALAASWFHALESGQGLQRNPGDAARWLEMLPPPEAAIALAKVIKTACNSAKVGPTHSAAELDALFEKMEMSSPPPQAYRLIQDAGLFARETDGNKWYLRAAKGGIASAMLDVARQYAEGYGRTKSATEAGNWYRKAAATGDPHANLMAGRYWLDQGDVEEAERLFRVAASQGDGLAWEHLGDICLEGKAASKRVAEAAGCYRKAAETGGFAAAGKLVVLLESKKAKPIDAQEMARWNAAIDEALAEEDSRSRIYILTNTARKIGNGPHGDKKAAMRWWIRAAEAGDTSSARLVLLVEEPVEAKAKAKAFEVLKTSAEAGDSYDMYMVARAYEVGNGTKASAKEATRWYEAAAEKGDYFSLQLIGDRYLKGEGVPKDLTKAIKWYKTAIREGSTTTMATMGHLYSDGKHLRPDGEEAVKWFETAAAFGDGFSMYNLCILYLSGDIVPKDYVEAYVWANAAAAGDDDAIREKAIKLRKALEEVVSPESVQKAQERTQQFFVIVKESKAWLTKRIQAGKPVILSFDEPLNFHFAKVDVEDEEPAPEARPGPDRNEATKESAGEGRVIGSATAWAVSAEGHLMTAAHAVKGATMVTVTAADGTKQVASILKTDVRNDLALLKIEGKTRPLMLRPKVLMGESVATIGFPNSSLQGSAAKVTEGIVSSLSGPEDDPRLLQISVPVQPGNSGGPLLDRSGAVVGMIQARLSDAATFEQSGSIPQVVNYAQKISLIQTLLEGIEVPDAVTKGDKLELPDMVEKARPSVYLLEIR